VVEIAASVGTSEESVLEALEAGQRYRTASIDAPDRQDGSIALRLGHVDAGFVGTDDRILLAMSMADLPERERAIIKLRFVDGLTQSEIADQVGLSQMHVSRLLTASLAKFREAFDQEP
jgi:RNA polymerase sigma-B factor